MSSKVKVETTEEKAPALRVLADYVLVKQTMKKKLGRIITDAAASDKDKFDYSFEVVQLGSECKRGIKVGEHPIFGEYVRFSGLKVVEKTETSMISLIIVHENDIIAVDDDPVAL